MKLHPLYLIDTKHGIEQCIGGYDDIKEIEEECEYFSSTEHLVITCLCPQLTENIRNVRKNDGDH